MARPSLYSEKLCDEIVERVSNGEPLAQVCRDDHMPALRTVYDWMAKDADLSARIARARIAGFDMIAAGTMEIADEPPPRTERGVDSGHVAWVKNRIWTRLQLLAKWDPKRYSDRLELAGDPSAPLVSRIERVVIGGNPKDSDA